MGKIGILTYHNNENCGAILQAYSLCRAMSDIFGQNVEVIDYRTKSKERNRKSQLVVSRRPLRIGSRIKDRNKVEGFIEFELPTSENSIVTDNHEEAVEWLENQNYDILVTGSDEVWKLSSGGIDNILAKIFPSRPFPNLYFLDPNLSAMKVAYAASANETDIGQMDPEISGQIREHLGAYDAISVRDRHTERMVKEFGVAEASRVPDPTILVDLPQRDVEDILLKNGVDMNKPILGFHGSDLEILGEICQHYQHQGYQVVTPKESKYADVELKGEVDPFEYHSLYTHFNLTVTTSLHSTIFSLKHGTPFATIDINKRYDSLESKTHSLLDDFGMLDRHFNATDGDTSKFFGRIAEVERELDHAEVSERTSQLEKRGKDFLEEVKQTYEKNY